MRVYTYERILKLQHSHRELFLKILAQIWKKNKEKAN